MDRSDWTAPVLEELSIPGGTFGGTFVDDTADAGNGITDNGTVS